MASPRDDLIGRMPLQFDADTEPMGAPGATRRQADVIQARLFDKMLRAEIAQLEQRADAIAYHWWARRDREQQRPPTELVELRRLLETLQGRFLRPRR